MGWSKIASFTNDANYVASPTTGGPLTCTISGISIGDVLIVSFQYGLSDFGNSIAVTDNAGTPNTYTSEVHAFDTGDNQGGYRASTPVTNVTGLTTITISWGGTTSNFLSILVEQWRHSGGALSGSIISGTPAGQYQATPGTGTDAITSGTTSPSVDGCLIHSTVVFGNSTPTTTTVGTGFTSAVNDLATAQVATEFLTQGTHATIAGTWTEGSAQPSVCLVTAYAPPGGAAAPEDQSVGYILRGPVNRTPRAKAVFTGLSMQFDNQDPYAPPTSPTDDQNTTQLLRMRGLIKPKMQKSAFQMFMSSYIDSYVPALIDPLMIDSQALRMRGLVKRYSPLSNRASATRVTNDSTNAAPPATPDSKVNWMPEAIGHIWHRR